MKLWILLILLGIAALPTAAGAEESPRSVLRLVPKEAIASSLPRKAAVFTGDPLASPVHDLVSVPAPPPRRERLWSCKDATTLCYDPEAGRIVYKPARLLMPDIPGLRAENITVKRDRIVFRYSF